MIYHKQNIYDMRTLSWASKKFHQIHNTQLITCTEMHCIITYYDMRMTRFITLEKKGLKPMFCFKYTLQIFKYI